MLGDAMILGILEIVSFFITIVFIGLWIAYPSANYEPFAALFGLLGSGCDLVRRFKSRGILPDHDRKLAQKFRGLFSEPGLIQQYQGHDFMLPLRREAVAPLNEVAEIWTDESHKFVDQRLRPKGEAFVKAATELALEIAHHTVPDGHGNVSVITRHMDPENLPAHVRDEAKAIDAKLPAFLRAHEELLALCNELT